MGQLPRVLFDPHPGDTDVLLVYFQRKQRGINIFLSVCVDWFYNFFVVLNHIFPNSLRDL